LLKKEDLKDEPTKIITARHSEITIFHIGKEPYAAASLLKKCTHTKKSKNPFLIYALLRKEENKKSQWNIYTFYTLLHSKFPLLTSQIQNIVFINQSAFKVCE